MPIYKLLVLIYKYTENMGAFCDTRVRLLYVVSEQKIALCKRVFFPVLECTLLF